MVLTFVVGVAGMVTLLIAVVQLLRGEWKFGGTLMQATEEFFQQMGPVDPGDDEYRALCEPVHPQEGLEELARAVVENTNVEKARKLLLQKVEEEEDEPRLSMEATDLSIGERLRRRRAAKARKK
jgi:hypothetical protein